MMLQEQASQNQNFAIDISDRDLVNISSSSKCLQDNYCTKAIFNTIFMRVSNIGMASYLYDIQISIETLQIYFTIIIMISTAVLVMHTILTKF